jgi:TonB family protein
MNPFTAVTTLIALVLCWNQPAQTSFEKRAVEDTKRTLASELDAELPRVSFAEWLGKVVGPDAGIVWQLSECGEQLEASPNGAGNARACAEANAMLPDGRRVIVMIAVGTFKEGMTGPPSFHFGVIEQEGELRPIRRLGRLQTLLLDPEKLAKSPAVELPQLSMPNKIGPLPNNSFAERDLMWIGDESRQFAPIEDLPAPEAPPPPSPPTPISVGDAVVKVQPRYPAKARRVSAVGMVDVQVTVSPEGRVTEAKAISGHPLLREAAEEAALQWVFKPAIANGAPVSTQIILTFRFKAPGGDDD